MGRVSSVNRTSVPQIDFAGAHVRDRGWQDLQFGAPGLKLRLHDSVRVQPLPAAGGYSEKGKSSWPRQLSRRRIRQSARACLCANLFGDRAGGRAARPRDAPRRRRKGLAVPEPCGSWLPVERNRRRQLDRVGAGPIRRPTEVCVGTEFLQRQRAARPSRPPCRFDADSLHSAAELGARCTAARRPRPRGRGLCSLSEPMKKGAKQWPTA